MTGTISALSTGQQALPAGLALWRLANRILGPRWAKVTVAAAAVAAVVAYSRGRPQRSTTSRNEDPVAPRGTDDRLDDELSDSFPASDPLTVTRA